jgi:hypothetical protein
MSTMYFNNPIPRSGLPKFHESSRLRSPRDADAVPRLWQRSRTVTEQLFRTTQAVEQVQRQLNRLRRRQGAQEAQGEDYYPFKIYQSPANPAWTAEEMSDKGWRTFRVRAGAVGLTDVIGTDGGIGGVPQPNPPTERNTDPNYDPDNAMIPDYDSGIDFEVTSGEKWYVWIDNTDTDNPEINAAATPPEGGWWTPDYILIGTIDCETYADDKIAVIRQYRRQDIPLAQGCWNNVTQDMPV